MESNVLEDQDQITQPQPTQVALPQPGDLAEGIVIAKEPSRLFLDLGVFGTGIVFGREFKLAREFINGVKTGDTLKAKVVEIDNEEGYVELSLQETSKEIVWETLRQKMLAKEIFPVHIRSANKGGLIAEIENIQAFLPVSQLSSEHYPQVEGGEKEKILQELQKFVNKTLQVEILDLDLRQNKLILSERAVEEAALGEKLKRYQAGDIITGKLKTVKDFGVFIRFGEDMDIEGFAHISELDWQMVNNPADLYAPGDEVKGKIINIEDGKVSLSLKALKPDPWEKFAAQHARLEILEGVVTRLNPFGAFVEVAPGIQGLVYIAEFKGAENMRRELKIGEKYKFRIAAIEPKEHRMSLKPAREHDKAEVEHRQENAVTEEKPKEPDAPSELSATEQHDKEQQAA